MNIRKAVAGRDWFNMSRFVTSDSHFWHSNILKYQENTRPYKTVEEMNEALIERHNAKVKPTDQVWIIGDFSFGKLEETLAILRRLNGEKHFVPGNHDKLIFKNMAAFVGDTDDNSKFKVLDKDIELTHSYNGESYHIVMHHFPKLEWHRSHYGAMMWHGHCHGHCWYPWDAPRRIFDVGVDCHPNNEPFAFEEIIDILKQRPVIKHH